MSPTLLIKTRKSIRRAVTLVEVIFAIGVVLIGLVGLLSILPLAGRRADDAISLNASAELAESVIDELLVRNFGANGQLLKLDKTTLAQGDSFVIDPMFCSTFESNEGLLPGSLPNRSNTNYDQELFPYYDEFHDPLTDPSGNSLGSIQQPRLFRVGVIAPPMDPMDSTEPRRFRDREQGLLLAEDINDLDVFRNRDRTLPATFPALQSSTNGLAYGKRVPNGTYSWFATVNPFPDNVYASVSVVVVKNRERDFVVPNTLAAGPADPTDPEENMVAERIATVTDASGFRGGAGGVAHLTSSLATVSRLRSNDWIMLSANPPGGAVHRWFRIVSIDGDPIEDSTAGTWQHKVLLDGPDWNVGLDTYATLVDGVVSVTERSVLLSDL